jgi:hypothetical protein
VNHKIFAGENYPTSLWITGFIPHMNKSYYFRPLSHNCPLPPLFQTPSYGPVQNKKPNKQLSNYKKLYGIAIHSWKIHEMQKAQNIDTPTVNLRVKIVGGMAMTAGEACKLTTSTGKDGYIVIFHWEDDCREKSDSTTAIRPTIASFPLKNTASEKNPNTNTLS